jgi:hypothetical protein
MTDIIPVSDRAREAAASAYNPSFHPGIKRETELGERDQTPHVQAFARFEQSLSTDKERLIEALEVLKNRAWNLYQTTDYGDMEFENAIGLANAALQDHQS